ncbi:hypothetical protein EZ428_00355 [Pedobacter frigiditerrae]|uniref:Protochlamydia outer membrane protein domain-containing protein n=1 Tax=Pedobacter frigiditerrae TaxID=2530452 RepID=A0A4R0N0L9_9SPHI|nr:hypothetical protein [Pedobacter frigiditerrae]TCC93259.1 hypothetical protein EZ428_00355 [Pedobacter frigiditerrae]
MGFSIMALAQADTLKKWNIKPFVGLHNTNCDWSIAGNSAGKNPNILSELIWDNLKGFGFGIEVKYTLPKNLSLKASSEYYKIKKGQATDTDYADDNRESPFYSDVLNADKGHLFNSSLHLSYQALTFGKLNISPIIGIAYNQQEFQLLESINNPSTAGLNSTYKVKYRGFDFGTAIIFKNRLFNLSLEVLGGFYKYGAEANWNLIPDFEKPVSFIHKANSFKLAGDLNLSVPINKQLKVELDYKIHQMKTHAGIDRAFYINEAPKETLFNGATLNTNALCLGLSFNF